MNKRYQSGATAFAMIFVVLMAVGWLLIAYKTVPAYLDDRTLASVLEGLQRSEDVNSGSEKKIRSLIDRRLSINGMRSFDLNLIEVAKEDDVVYIDIVYETKETLFRNVYVGMSFEHHFEKKVR